MGLTKRSLKVNESGLVRSDKISSGEEVTIPPTTRGFIPLAVAAIETTNKNLNSYSNSNVSNGNYVVLLGQTTSSENNYYSYSSGTLTLGTSLTANHFFYDENSGDGCIYSAEDDSFTKTTQKVIDVYWEGTNTTTSYETCFTIPLYEKVEAKLTAVSIRNSSENYIHSEDKIYYKYSGSVVDPGTFHNFSNNTSGYDFRYNSRAVQIKAPYIGLSWKITGVINF